jgi:hypothetical protein
MIQDNNRNLASTVASTVLLIMTLYPHVSVYMTLINLFPVPVLLFDLASGLLGIQEPTTQSQAKTIFGSVSISWGVHLRQVKPIL